MTGDHEASFEAALSRASELLAEADAPGALEEANEAANEALMLRPDAAQAWVIKAYVLSALADDPAAYAAARLATTLTPDLAEPHYACAMALCDMEVLDLAERELRLAFDHLPAEDLDLVEDLYYLEASIFTSKGDNDAALAALERGLERCPWSDLLRQGLEPLRTERRRRALKVIDGGR